MHQTALRLRSDFIRKNGRTNSSEVRKFITVLYWLLYCTDYILFILYWLVFVQKFLFLKVHLNISSSTMNCEILSWRKNNYCGIKKSNNITNSLLWKKTTDRKCIFFCGEMHIRKFECLRSFASKAKQMCSCHSVVLKELFNSNSSLFRLDSKYCLTLSLSSFTPLFSYNNKKKLLQECRNQITAVNRCG